MFEGFERYKYWLNPYNFTGQPLYDVLLNDGRGTVPVTKVNLPVPLPQDEETGVYTISFTVFETYSQVIEAGYYSESGSAFNAAHRYNVLTSIADQQKREDAESERMDAAFRSILTGSSSYSVLFSDVAKLAFSETSASDPGVITFGQLTSAFKSFDGKVSIPSASTDTIKAEGAREKGTSAQIFVNPESIALGGATIAPKVYGDIWINLDQDLVALDPILGSVWSVDAQIVPGTKAYTILMEEIAHALGIDIENPDRNNPKDLANVKYSVTAYANHPDMYYSYTGLLSGNDKDSPKLRGPYPLGLQLFDIAALQEIYGRNYQKLSEDTRYSKDTAFATTRSDGAFVYTIWDGGGVDLIDASGYTRSIPFVDIDAKHQIDLRQGMFSSIGFNGDTTAGFAKNVPFDTVKNGVLYDAGNLAIAYYAVIENAIGGNNDDYLIGNAWDNVLYGADGKDLIFGDSPSYSRFLGIEDDEFKLDDQNRPGAQASEVNGNDILLGGRGDDRLFGGAGDDVLHGGYRKQDVDAATSGWGGGYWDSAGQFTGVHNASGAAIGDIPYALDGDDTADYSRLEAGVGVKVSLGGASGTVVKGSHGGGNYIGTDGLYSIEHLVGTASDDTIDVDVSSGGVLKSLKGGDGNDTLNYYGGTRAGTEQDLKIYDLKGSLIFGRQDTQKFNSIENVAHYDGSRIMNTAQQDDYFGYLVDAIYSLNTQGIDVDVVQDFFVVLHMGQWLVWEDFSIRTNAGTSGTHFISYSENLIGTNYDDAFSVNQTGGVPVDYEGPVRYVRIAPGLGDDTVDIGHLYAFMHVDVTYRGGHDVYYIENPYQVTLHFDDEILISNVWVESVSYNNSDVIEVVFNIGTPDNTLTLIGSDLRDLQIVFDSGGAGFVDEVVVMYGWTETVRDVYLGWNDDVFYSTTFAYYEDITVYGLLGNDVFHSGFGNDTFYGGAGSDTLMKNAGGGNTYFVGGEGDAFDVDALDYRGISGPMNYTINGNSITTSIGVDVFSGVERIYLSNGGGVVTILEQTDATITAGSGGNTIYGSSGNDRIVPGSGVSNETVYGGGGDDTLYAYFGSDSIYGEEGNDTISVFAGNHTVDGGTGDDRIILLDYFTGYQSTMNGGEGFDTLDLSSSILSTITLSGNTLTTPEFGTYFIENFEAVRGTGGNNTIYGDANKSYHLYGGFGNDVIYAGNQGDYLYGEEGFDTLYGGDGDDVLDGGALADMLIGGLGNDTYVYRHPGDVDTIDDAGGDADRILIGGGLKIADMQIGYSGSTMDIFFNSQRMIEVLNATTSGAIEFIDFEDGSRYDVVSDIYTLMGTEETDVLTASGSENRMFGLDGDDTLEATSGINVFDGGAGDDILRGGNNSDLYIFSQGRDVIEEASDSISGGSDALFFGGGFLPEYLDFYRIVDEDASAHDDLIIGDGFGNAVTIKGQFAANPTSVESFRFSEDVWLPNTTGIDDIAYTDIVSALDIRVATYGSDNDNVLHGVQSGASPNDYLYGFGGDDIIWGYDGDDVISGGAGDDTLHGGSGNDEYLFSNGDGADVIVEQSGNLDRIRFDETVSIASVAYIQDGDDLLIRYGTGTDNITVSNFFLHDDFKVEEVVFADNTLHDVNYILNYLNGGSGTITGTSGADVLDGTSGADVIRGLGGADTLYGYDGDDLLIGGNGHDSLYGGTGNDILRGGSGNDLLVGGAGNDILKGGAGNDILRGGNGDDVLRGGDGDDRLIGGRGSDILDGGSGTDTFVFRTSHIGTGVDTIKDFSLSQGDKIDISDILSAYDPVTDALADFVQFTRSGKKSIMSVDLDGAGTDYGWVQVAVINGHTSLDPDQLVATGHLLVA